MTTPSLITLVRDEFHSLYSDVAQRIAQDVQAEARIDFDQLEAAHREWKYEIYDYLEHNPSAPSQQSFWTYTFSVLTKNLCSVDCISYMRNESKQVPINIKDIQSLVTQYPNQYTALEFVKTRHLELYSMIHDRPTKLEAPELHDLKKLETILRSLKQYPSQAIHYASLLHLPVN